MEARMRMALGAVALVATLLLAGCGGKPEPREIEVAPGQVIVVEEPLKPSNGIVAGLVGNDALYPLPGTFIRIVGLELNATTDENGRFAIVDVPPGIFILEGSKKDHKSVQTTVDVQPGEVAKAVLLLQRVPPTDPYHLTWSHNARLQYSAPLVSSGRNVTLSFSLDASRPVTVVLESVWDGTIVQQDPNFLLYRLQELDGKEVLRDSAANPVSFHVDARVLPPDRADYRFTVEPDPLKSVVYQATGQTFATVFYNQAAPPGWSILTGST